MEWEAEQPHQQIVKPKGNTMTQKYYVERLLPVYIEAIHKQQATTPDQAHNWILQEDNDTSRGTRKFGLPQALRDHHQIKTLVHSAQSPDLSPIEAC